MTQRRTLSDLVNTSEPGWPIVAAMIANARNPVEVLPVSTRDGERALVAIQVTTRSPMGAVAYTCGGLLVDHGWIRVLGGGGPRLNRDLGSWNFPRGHAAPPRLEGAFLVADDLLGGFFAMNGGAFDGPPGHVFYLAPDTMKWEDTGKGYTDFIAFLCAGDLERFYASQRWKNWAEDAAKLPGDRAFSIYPFLFSSDGGTIDERSRKDVPIEELWHVHLDLQKQLANVPDGTKVHIKIGK